MYPVGSYQMTLHVKKIFDIKAGAQKIKMKSNSDPRIYMKNFSAQQSCKGTNHNTSYNSNTNYSVQEAISRSGILSLLTMPQLESQTHIPPGLGKEQH